MTDRADEIAREIIPDTSNEFRNLPAERLRFAAAIRSYAAEVGAELNSLARDYSELREICDRAEADRDRLAKEVAGFRAALTDQIKQGLEYRLNEYLCEMKPDWDDSITGFNEAWEIVSAYFVRATEKDGK